MSWTKSSQNGFLLAKETSTLPDAIGSAYSAEIDFLKLDPSQTNKWVTMWIKLSGLDGTNVDVALYGADKSGGTKFLLLDAIVTDITDTTASVKLLDLNAYPAPYYYIMWTVDADESANTVEVKWLTPDAENLSLASSDITNPDPS